MDSLLQWPRADLQEYIQMSGRAGRRGLDARGIVIMMCDEKIEPDAAKNMVKGQADRLDSAFHLGYNMIINLMRVEGISPEFMLERCFFQFQNTMSVPVLEKGESGAEIQAFGLTRRAKGGRGGAGCDCRKEGRRDQGVLRSAAAAQGEGSGLPGRDHAPDVFSAILEQWTAGGGQGRRQGLWLGYRARLQQSRYAKSELLLSIWNRKLIFQGRPPVFNPASDPPQKEYVVDVLVKLATGTQVSKDSSISSLEPPAAGDAGQVSVIPVLLSTIQSISQLRVKVPADLRSQGDKNTVYRALGEVMRRMPGGPTLLDPIKNMGITDKSFMDLVKVSHAHLLSNRG